MSSARSAGRIRPSIAVRCVAVTAVVALLGFAMVACDSDSGGQPIESDQQLSDELLQLSRQGEDGRLADLTSFDWDDVYVYFEGASAEEIANDVGSELKMNDRYYSAGCLMVFVSEDEVVRALTMPEVLGWNGDNRFSAEVKLVPGRPGKSSGLQLVEPGADSEKASAAR